MRKQFKDIDIYAGIKAQDGAKWIKDNGIVENWKTPEHIEVRPVYTKEDLEGMEHLDFTAGIFSGSALLHCLAGAFAPIRVGIISSLLPLSTSFPSANTIISSAIFRILS